MLSLFTRVPASAATLCLLIVSRAYAQTISPSNNTQDLYPASSSPRFLLNGTEFPNLPAIRLAPIGEYAQISHSTFLSVNVQGRLVNVGASNANDISSVNQFSYLSCDPSAYVGNLGPSDVFRIVVNSPRTNIVILYSETSDHCTATGLASVPSVGSVLTTTDVMAATSLANLRLGVDSVGTCTILPDLNSYTNTTDGHGWNNSGGTLGQSPTTAVAMIILYSITGIITALFVVIIITGAIRAHRHPERYGPRHIVGRGRQSRAKGIARAMLETLPIVKFGDHDHLTEKTKGRADVEMNTGTTTAGDEAADKAVPPTAAVAIESDENYSTEAQMAGGTAHNPDGRDNEGHLGCSICTEDFTKGEEVRVLPCNHKFHPDCVDPWLLNVSGTCPLCRIDLRPQGDEAAAGADNPEAADGPLPPPLADSGTVANISGRRDTVATLRNLASGTREERIAALRRMRQEHRTTHQATDDERRGLTRRFRERFRIRTERRGTMVETSVAGEGDTPRRPTWAPDTRTS